MQHANDLNYVLLLSCSSRFDFDEPMSFRVKFPLMFRERRSLDSQVLNQREIGNVDRRAPSASASTQATERHCELLEIESWGCFKQRHQEAFLIRSLVTF
jgi:hypothetical protein